MASKYAHNIPLIKAEHVLPLIQFADSHGANTEALLEKARLPGRIREQPDGLVPEHRTWLFADIAAHSLAMPDFGLQLGKAFHIEQLGKLGKQLDACPTLFTCIAAFCELVKEESSNAQFWLSAQGDTLWFSRGGVPGIHFGEKHIEHYVLLLMIEIVRLKLGRLWQPKHIKLKSPACKLIANDPLFSETAIAFNQNYSAIAISRNEAAIPVSSNAEILLSGHPAEHVFVDNMVSALSLYKQKEFVGIDEAADILGMSSRTLQRRLKDNGVSYKSLIDQMRLKASLNLMQDDSISLTDVALELGYSDSAHFSRAFMRWTGLPPSKYRRSHLLEGIEI